MEAEKLLKKYLASAKVDVKGTMQIRKYLNSCSGLVRQANVYRDEKDILSAIFLYTRCASMVVDDLHKHPEYTTLTKAERAAIRAQARLCLEEAERLRPPVLEIYQLRISEKQKRGESAPPLPEPTEENFSGGLREILLPKSLIPQFLNLAQQNTDNNVETCGLLTGTLQRNRLIATVLIIPEQSGSSDHCVAENDIDTFNVIDQRGLLSLGWIHTHPSQKAFLSSVDLHTQFGYQAMMPEALAIVCAPKYSNEIFRLTEMGMDVVGKCTQMGFHPHSQSPLFETATHARTVDIPCEVINLRK